MPGWFKDAVAGVNVLMETEEGEHLLKKAIEEWIPANLDPEVARRLLVCTPVIKCSTYLIFNFSLLRVADFLFICVSSGAVHLHPLDELTAVKKIFQLHAQRRLRIKVDYHTNAEKQTYLSTFRHILPATKEFPAVFEACVAMSSNWRTRAAAVAGKEPSIAACASVFSSSSCTK